jgi:preprotein translocase subunit YajC
VTIAIREKRNSLEVPASGVFKERDLSGLLGLFYITTLLLAQAADSPAAPSPAAKSGEANAPAAAPAKPGAPAKADEAASEPAATDEAAPAGDAPAGGITDALFSTYALPLGAMLLLMYFMLLRPEQKKRKEVEQTLSSLKKNDHIVTIGGICGTVVNISPGSQFITIKVDESNNTRLKILRSAVARVGEVEDQDNKIEAKKESA